MTSAATFTTLHAPAQEDSMDMSSPALYDDIEIDFDEQPGGVDLHITDPDRMTDDGEHTRPGTATDLMMEDDLQLPELHVPEQDMQDDFDSVRYEAQNGDGDDDLIDYDDGVYDDTTVVGEQPADVPADQLETHEEQPVDVNASADPEGEQVDEEIIRQPEDLSQQPPVVLKETVLEEVPVTEAADPEVQASGSPVLPAEGHEGPTPAAGIAGAAVPAAASTAADDTAEDVDGAHNHAPEKLDEQPVDKHVRGANVPTSLNTSLSFATDAPGTPTDTGLHPMTICYGDHTLPLFRSKNSPDGLLKNDNLVSVSIAELLNNCRQRISIKLHEDVPEDMDLILLFDGLNLSVTESDHQCSVITLNEVLNVYTQLHANEGVQDVPPFSLTLYTQSKFSSTFNILKQGAEAGHGISAYIDNTADQHEDEDFTGEYQDQLEDSAPLHFEDGTQEQYTDNEQSYLDQGATQGQEYGYQDQDDTTAYDDAVNGEGEYEGQEDETAVPAAAAAVAEAQTDLTQPHEEDVAEPEYHDVAQELDAEDQAAASPHEDHHDAADAPGELAVYPTQAEDERFARGLHGEEEDGRNVESGASSTTLRADHAEAAVGKYFDEERLEFDDEPFVLTPESELGFDGHDDYSTFITELDEEAAAPVDTESKLDASGAIPETTNALEENQNTDGSRQTLGSTAEALADVHNVQTVGEDGLQSYEEDETLGFDGNATEYFDLDQDDSLEEPHDYEGNQEDFHTGQDLLEGADPEQLGLESADIETAKAISAHQETPVENPEDSIDFDDDTEEQHEARKASAAGVTPGSPSGKRSFDATESLYDDEDEPELKKPRSS